MGERPHHRGSWPIEIRVRSGTRRPWRVRVESQRTGWAHCQNQKVPCLPEWRLLWHWQRAVFGECHKWWETGEEQWRNSKCSVWHPKEWNASVWVRTQPEFSLSTVFLLACVMFCKTTGFVFVWRPRKQSKIELDFPDWVLVYFWPAYN